MGWMAKPIWLPVLLALCLVVMGPRVTLAQAFPRDVEHALGVTRINAPPQRIVTIGWSGEDVVIALGHVPVGMTDYRFFPSGVSPWNEEALDGILPKLLSDGEVDFEEIATLQPDLILAVYSGVDATDYKRLSEIAPTVVYRSAPWTAGWQEQTQVIGDALGQSERATALITDTFAGLHALAAQSPDIVGKTFVYGTYFAGGSGIVVYLPRDPRVSVFTELGLKIPPFVAELAKRHPNELSILVGFEEISKLDPDFLIMWLKPGARGALEQQPIFQTLRAVQLGEYFPLEDAAAIWATSALSVRSIPYFFPKFVSDMNAKIR